MRERSTENNADVKEIGIKGLRVEAFYLQCLLQEPHKKLEPGSSY